MPESIRRVLAQITSASDQLWKSLIPPEQMRVWTDDYSNIVAVLKLGTRD
jgi:hypothetical protein